MAGAASLKEVLQMGIGNRREREGKCPPQVASGLMVAAFLRELVSSSQFLQQGRSACGEAVNTKALSGAANHEVLPVIICRYS
jgi:hypothetical protein